MSKPISGKNIYKENINLLSNKSVPRVFRLLTLKATRKPASENVVYLCRLLNILADFLKKYFCIQANSVDPDQTAPKGAV